MVEARTAERDRMWRLSTDVMLVAQFDGSVVAANPAWTTMLGWTGAELLGGPSWTSSTPTTSGRPSNRPGCCPMGRRSCTSRTDTAIATAAIAGSRGRPSRRSGLIHAVGRDVTALKDAAAQLETTRESLRQSQRMEALGQLAGGIAHDFNNVLQSVSGGVNLIRRRAEDPAVQKIAEMVADASARGAAITGRLLSFARQGELQSARSIPTPCCAGLTEMLTHTLGPGVTVRTEVGAGHAGALRRQGPAGDRPGQPRRERARRDAGRRHPDHHRHPGT